MNASRNVQLSQNSLTDLGGQLKRLNTRLAIGFGGVGAATLALIFASDPRQALASYLFAYCCVFTTVVGALMLVMIAELTGAKWFVPLRPLALRIGGSLPALAVLIIPILWKAQVVYTWATPALLPPDVHELVARKRVWLSVPFFVGRAFLYLAVWNVVGEMLRRTDVRGATRVSALSLIAVGLTFTFASFDWVMSVEPAWFSTMYGVYLFAGGILAALGCVTVGSEGRPRALIERHANTKHPQTLALATLLFTFSMFWAYIAFSQYLIVWIADVPAEVTWYVARTTAGWRSLAVAVLVGQFVVPFALFLSFSLKRKPAVVVAVAAWLLVMHVLDCYWLVMPAFHGGSVQVHLADLAALLMVVGVTCAAALLRPKSVALPQVLPTNAAELVRT